MKRNFRNILTFAILAFCGLIGGWLIRDLGTVASVPIQAVLVTSAREPETLRAHRVARTVYRDEFRDGTTVEMFASSKPDEIILRFPSDEAYQSFLIALSGSHIRLVDQLDRLRAMRLSYDDWDEFSGLLEGEHIAAYDALPSVPAPNPVSVGRQDDLLGFGDSVLPWLGITTDNSSWGKGVRVAVIDSGVVPHPDLPGLSTSIAITPFPEDLNKTYGHGTAVASLIAGNNPQARGIAPAVDLISIRVGGETGKADSFALASGILAALDAKVQIMNISMGTTENNPLIEEAVLMARNQNVLIVAASGNSAKDEACYPAAYPSVISVGAVDARGEHLDFSNYGTYLSLTAPGYAINAAWPSNRHVAISGTSASAPIVTAAIAATMSNGTGVRMTASQAADIVMRESDEAGLPGPDSEYGVGILNMARVLNRNTPGIIDAAITDQRLVQSGQTGRSDALEVTLQNRGTTVLVNTLLEISTPVGTGRFNATTLAPGAIQTFSLPIRLSDLPRNGTLQVSSHITLGSAGNDITPQNNQRVDSLSVP